MIPCLSHSKIHTQGTRYIYLICDVQHPIIQSRGSSHLLILFTFASVAWMCIPVVFLARYLPFWVYSK